MDSFTSLRDTSLPRCPSEDELTRDWTLSTLDHLEVSKCRGDHNRVRFAIQLCALRKYCRFLDSYSQVPVRIINHICSQLELPPTLQLQEPEREATEYEYLKRIREYLNYHVFDERIKEELIKWLATRAVEGMLPYELFQRAEQLLQSWHVILPGSSTITRLVNHVASTAKEEFFEFINSRLSENLKNSLDDLIGDTGSDGKTKLFHLKEFPPNATGRSIVEYIGHFELVDSIIKDFDTGVDDAMQKHLAQLTKRYDATALKRFVPAKRYALLVCFLAEARKTLLDHIVAMHDQFMTDLSRKCRNKHDKKLKKARKRSKTGMALILDATEIIVDPDIDVSMRADALFEQIEEEKLRECLETCRDLQKLENRGLVDEFCRHYSGLRHYLPKFLTLDFQSSVGTESMVDAVQVARSIDPIKPKLPNDSPCNFVPAAWTGNLYKTDGSIDRRVWEISLSIAIRDSLRSGDVYLSKSRKHVSFWNLVYDDDKWDKEKKQAYASLSLPSASNDLFHNLRKEYSDALSMLQSELPKNELVKVVDEKLHLKKTDKLKHPESVEKLRDAIEANVRKIRIEDLLQEVDRHCQFTKEFRPLGGYTSRASNLHIGLLANLIAQGTNLGIAAMASSADLVSVDMLQHVNQWYFSQETISAANASLVNYHSSLPLTKLYGDGDISSSDGQRFGIQKKSLLASFYPRYFGYYDRAITLYTHISDQYSVFNTQAISCGPREALYVLDGLLDNQTTLRPREHVTDTHGFTEQLFGLCYLLGFSFMPRLKDLPDQRLYKFDKDTELGELEPIFEAPINLSLISEQWDQLVRVAASLKDKVAPAHVVLHRLVNSSPSDKVAKALTALGRLVKTVYIMQYLSDPALRHKVQLQLNRGELRHYLAKWLFFADRGEFRTGDYEEIMNKASCLSLLSNAVLVWNTLETEKIVLKLRSAGEEVNDNDLALIAPLFRYHVIPTGTYFHSNSGKSKITILEQ